MPHSFHDACRSLLLSIVAAEPDPAEQRAMLEIMRSTGHLTELEDAA